MAPEEVNKIICRYMAEAGGNALRARYEANLPVYEAEDLLLGIQKEGFEKSGVNATASELVISISRLAIQEAYRLPAMSHQDNQKTQSTEFKSKLYQECLGANIIDLLSD
jgi:hypothetical protein